MTETREISLIDLMWRILFGWRTVLAWTVVVAILCTAFAGYKFSKAMADYENELKVYNEKLDASEGSEESRLESLELMIATQKGKLTVEEILMVEDAYALRDKLVKQEDYVQDSILMNVEAHNETVLKTSFAVEDDRYCDALVSAYLDRISSGELAKRLQAYIKNTTGEAAELVYYAELISAAAVYDGTKLTTNEGAGCRRIAIEIVYPDSKVLEGFAKEVEAYINEIHVEVSRGVANHLVRDLTSTTLVRNDESINSKQYSATSTLNTYRSWYTSLRNSLTEDQKSLLDAIVMQKAGIERMDVASTNAEQESATEDSGEIDLTPPAKPSLSKKYIALGIVLGLFMGCCWIACVSIFSTKLQNREELERYYHFRSLGSLKTRDINSCRGLDKVLYKLRYRGERALSLEERIELICSNASIVCKKNELSEVVVTGSCLYENNRELFEAIAKKLVSVGLKAEVAENVLYDAGALKRMSEVGAALLIEQVDVSKYKHIEEEINVLKGNGVVCVGCVGVE